MEGCQGGGIRFLHPTQNRLWTGFTGPDTIRPLYRTGSKEKNIARTALAYSQMGLELALTVGLAGWAGRWAEARWGFEPWGLIGGLVAGVVLGLTRFLLVAFRMSEDKTQEANDVP